MPDSFLLAREAGLEPATSKLTASCSTIELLPNTLFEKTWVSHRAGKMEYILHKLLFPSQN